MKNIKKILIANRSEIASRIIFACKNLNIKTVSIYTDEDCSLPYVFEADENIKLSKNGLSAYLEKDEIIFLAKKRNVDAIHPGYGFLSEDYDFAEKVINSGLIWIGPRPEIIKLAADKIMARNLASELNIPIIHGYYIDKNTTYVELEEAANEIGYPLIFKDPLSGGGKGIRKIASRDELIRNFEIFLKSSKKNLLVEKNLTNVKHIEVQIAGDGKNFIHLYERDCSVQRRHQKIIEFAPSYSIPKKMLDNIYKAALSISKFLKYDNIGTVEFLIDNNEKFYFLEINPRLQVEHSVTESITGTDIVNLQLELSLGLPLKFKQSDILVRNHSIECRIYAEDPDNNFMPSSGVIKALKFNHKPFIRVDHNLYKDIKITPFFDPMIAKITSWGTTREDAIKNMLTYLSSLQILGIKTNISLLIKILNSKEFIRGIIDTKYLTRKKLIIKKYNEHEQLIAAIISSIIRYNGNNLRDTKKSNWQKLHGNNK